MRVVEICLNILLMMYGRGWLPDDGMVEKLSSLDVGEISVIIVVTLGRYLLAEKCKIF